MPHFLYRLIAPRGNFATTMSAAEAELMKVHSVYWRDLVASGTALVFGPVADPDGMWGLAIFSAPSSADAEALVRADPVLAADMGFTSDVLPMLSAVTAAGLD